MALLFISESSESRTLAKIIGKLTDQKNTAKPDMDL